MAAAKTFNEKMVDALRRLLLENAGASSITIDGVTTSFVDLQNRLQQFEAAVARENGQRKRFDSSVTLGGFLP